MDDSSRLLMIVLLAFIVTYPVRAVPALFISKLELNPFWRRFLDMVPYCALTALVFPGVFYCVKDNHLAACVGTGVAILSGILRVPFALTVVLSVIAVYLILIL